MQVGEYEVQDQVALQRPLCGVVGITPDCKLSLSSVGHQFDSGRRDISFVFVHRPYTQLSESNFILAHCFSFSCGKYGAQPLFLHGEGCS